MTLSDLPSQACLHSSYGIIYMVQKYIIRDFYDVCPDTVDFVYRRLYTPVINNLLACHENI